MSGGVDSSLAAALLCRAGYEVHGVFMSLDGRGSGRAPSPPAGPDSAARVAEQLGVRFSMLDLSEQFAPIIDYFVAEYAAGRTPNPCVHCNARLKFGSLLEHADSLGAMYLATGHYARLVGAPRRDASCREPLAGPAGPAVARARSRLKDQSYVLFGVARASLGRIMLPLGEMAGKDEVRRVARQLGLAAHDRPDSQEICFVPDDDYVSLLRSRNPRALRGGAIVDSAGRELGRHEGYARYTIGQRRGLRVAAGVPMYVTDIDPAEARVTIGPRSEVMSRRLRAAGANWHRDVAGSFQATVQIRYRHEGAPGRVTVTEGGFEVEFDSEVSAVTPGQAAVLYDGDLVVGGGWVEGN